MADEKYTLIYPAIDKKIKADRKDNLPRIFTILLHEKPAKEYAFNFLLYILPRQNAINERLLIWETQMWNGIYLEAYAPE